MQESEHHGDRWFKDAFAQEQGERRASLDRIFQELRAATKAANYDPYMPEARAILAEIGAER